MNLVIPGIGIGWSVVLAATEQSDPPVWWTSIREFGSFGVLLFAVWYLGTKIMPVVLTHFRDTLEQQRKDFLSTIDKQHADYIIQQNENRVEQRRLSEAVQSLADKIQHVN